jgi:hypothetical protein
LVARQIRERLNEAGFQAVFLDFHEQDGIVGGTEWEQKLHRELRRADAVLALCSEHFA